MRVRAKHAVAELTLQDLVGISSILSLVSNKMVGIPGSDLRSGWVNKRSMCLLCFMALFQAFDRVGSGARFWMARKGY